MPTESSDRRGRLRRSLLLLRIEVISVFVFLWGVLIVTGGLVFLLFTIFSFFSRPSNAGGLSDRQLSTLATTSLIGVMVISIGILVIKLGWDFGSCKSWTYNLVRPFVRGSFFLRDSLDDEEIRKAFNQPEYEYPNMPEYGPKLDEPDADGIARKRPDGTTRDSQ